MGTVQVRIFLIYMQEIYSAILDILSVYLTEYEHTPECCLYCTEHRN